MRRESVFFGIAGALFGLLAGWIIGSQRVSGPAPTAAVPAGAQASSGATAPALDVQRASDLERQANARPADAAIRAELANLYFDAQRCDLAAPWYEASLKIDGKNVNVSTDLAVCYYYANDADRALKQIDHSLSLDPRHLKTLLNQGVIRAFGKQDLAGATESWQKIITIAPESEEARRARVALDALKTAHPDVAQPGAQPGTQPGAQPGGAGSGVR